MKGGLGIWELPVKARVLWIMNRLAEYQRESGTHWVNEGSTDPDESTYKAFNLSHDEAWDLVMEELRREP